MRLQRPPLPLILLFTYIVVTWYSLRQSALPLRPCHNNGSGRRHQHQCVHPLVSVGDNVSMLLYLYETAWTPIQTCHLNFSLPASSLLPTEVTISQNCTFNIAEAARRRWSDDGSLEKGGSLQAKFLFRLIQNEIIGPVVADVPVSLTKIVTKAESRWNSEPSSPRRLLESSTTEARELEQTEKNAKYVPYLRYYGSQPLLLRFVADTAAYGGPPFFRGDGIPIRAVPWNASAYYPTVYVDDNALERSAFREIAPPSEMMDKPPVVLRIQFSTVTPIRDVINQQVTMALSAAESLLEGSELDEFRYWLRDERLYRFLLTQVISFVHVWLDYLAFRDEVRFYRRKKDRIGVSVSSIVSRLISSFIIFLYLLDGGGTSWIVLLSIFSNVSVEAWKVWNVLSPTWTSTFPFIRIHGRHSNPADDETALFDRIATSHMLLFLSPLLIGWALYALQHYTYTSWYSWLISNLANGVYTFGFIGLCPQLYVNYRLKSVAHLPWKVFVYKIFNTFVDDVFAFLIDMPWKHRIMTLRDDVVFFMFLAQAWVYRVDKSRTNEYGYSYDENKEEKPISLGKEKVN